MLLAILLGWPSGGAAQIRVGRGDGAFLPRGPEAIEALRKEKRRASGEGHDDLEQVLVLPQRPGKNKVRWYGFDWRKHDYLDDDGIGGVRFYFYDREFEIARIGAALVREQYEFLVRKFDFRPTQRIPYILYNSHREFQNTNVFFVSEGVLGVTSPRDLRMALPYWGEIQTFRHVSTHEMVHQFTIQKAAERAAAAGLESGLMQMPLWFIEGLAEYYSQHGVDRETDMFARDMLLHPRPEVGYALIGFWDDAPGAFLYTYKLGQLRIAFLAETYGERIVQAVLDQSPRLGLPRPGGDPNASDEGRETFQTLLSRLCGETPENVSLRFSAWMRRRYLPGYLEAKQEPPTIEPIDLPGEPDAFSTARDGVTVLYRAVERDTGRSRLHLVDRRNPASAVEVERDGQPGLESLHPALRNVMAVGERHVAFFARDASADALYVVPYRRRYENARPFLDLGPRKRIDLLGADIIEAGDPTFSPDGSRLAFFGLDGGGRIDVWTVEVETGRLERLTDDLYAERDLVWSEDPPSTWGIEGGGGDGTIVFTTDATATRNMNLVAFDPATRRRARLTQEAADHRAPFALGGGLVVFATDPHGKKDVHLYDASTRRVKRLTDFVTGLSTPAPGPRGLTAIGFLGGRYRLFDVPVDAYLDLDERPAIEGAPDKPAVYPQEPIPDDAERYDATALKNWRLETGVAAVGTASVGQGALLFGDTLGDRSAIVQFAVLGNIELTDALAYYLDRSNRLVYGGGVFHTFTSRRDVNAPGFGSDVYYLQREFGVSGLVSYPFGTFSRVEAQLVAQGVHRSFQYPVTENGFFSPFVSLAALREWNGTRAGYDFETLASVRYGADTTLFRFPGGAFAGGSLFAELGAGVLPLRQHAHAYGYFDAQWHVRMLGFAGLHLRVAGGASAGSPFGRQFFLSSYDNLRGFSYGDRRLLNLSYLVANADVVVPLDALVRFALVTNVAGVIGADFGGVADTPGLLWQNRTLAGVLGFNVGLGPFEVRVHWAYPFFIGGLDLGEGWVPNISLRYAYF